MVFYPAKLLGREELEQAKARLAARLDLGGVTQPGSTGTPAAWQWATTLGLNPGVTM